MIAEKDHSNPGRTKWEWHPTWQRPFHGYGARGKLGDFAMKRENVSFSLPCYLFAKGE